MSQLKSPFNGVHHRNLPGCSYIHPQINVSDHFERIEIVA